MSLASTPAAGGGLPDLAVLTQDPRFGGGALAQLRAFVDGVASAGHTPRLLYARRPPLPDPSPLPHLPAVEARTALARLDSACVPVAARRLERPAREAETLWVVATVAFYGLTALRARRPFGCWIGTTHRSEQAGRRPGLDGARRLASRANAPALERWERAVLRGASVVLAPSEQIADELAATADVDRARIGVLPIPIDTRRFVPLPDHEWMTQPPRLVFVGRADDPRKNIGLLLDAFQMARTAIPDLRLRLVGRPPTGGMPDGVEAVGEVRNVADHVRDARILVMPSLQEGFGVVAAEALACGVPVVTTPCGGPEETVRHSGAGRVLRGFDAEELADVTLGLVEDESTLVSMRVAGRRHVLDRYGVERFRLSLTAAMGELDRAA